MQWVIGIDGGGSKTECVLAELESGAERGRASAGSAKANRVGEGVARTNLQQAARDACARGGARAEDVVQACVGISGASLTGTADLVRAALANAGIWKVMVVGDSQIAHVAAFGMGGEKAGGSAGIDTKHERSGAGVLVVSGTGSMAYGRDERGAEARAGGWGAAVSDEGSGQWIGRAAVAAVLRTHDSGDKTELTERVLGAWKLKSVDELVQAANASPDFAGLFPAVAAAAESGDKTARAVIAIAADELAQLAMRVVRRLWPESTMPVRVALAGGVARNSALLRSAFEEAMSRSRKVEIVRERVDAAMGAVELARAEWKAGQR